MYRRGETPGGKCKDEGSGRGTFKVISKLYLGHNIIKIHFVSAYMYIYGCNLAAYVTNTSLCAAHIGIHMYVILAVYCVALAGCIVMILLRSQHCKHGYNRTRLNSECMHRTHFFKMHSYLNTF